MEKEIIEKKMTLEERQEYFFDMWNRKTEKIKRTIHSLRYVKRPRYFYFTKEDIKKSITQLRRETSHEITNLRKNLLAKAKRGFKE